MRPLLSRTSIFRELLVVLIITFPPLFYALYAFEDELLTKMVASFIPQIEFLGYAAFLNLLALSSTVLNRWFYTPNDNIKGMMQKVDDVLFVAGETSLGLIRVLTGTLISILVLWLIYEPATFKLEEQYFFIIAAISGVIDCVALAYILERQNQQRKPRRFFTSS
ncbi:hypothetical protein CWI80_10315 [Pseudidiomarina sediminum]|uniref:Uncharacterized protein n=1 Tax=Pseudidiomarina sediminum TaxID=431675 RepID=A0A432Z2X3_9GAMM|nr:hypothetical protein [Pseudidiomarina sediminum]RUO72183.1 hypothetical protein CWI80_10315 [Pseudidiomarina sediminum]